jgi:UDP-N-acetyl-D-glucosamine dehydrogenase
MESQELTPEFLASQDCVLIVTDHSAYDFGHILKHSQLVVDTRNAMKSLPDPDKKIRRA